LKLLASFTLTADEAIRAEGSMHCELDSFDCRLIGEWFDISEQFMLEIMSDFFSSNGLEVIGK
jgi:hypothetical protein